MNDETVPADLTAMQAEEVVEAAIAWRSKMTPDSVMTAAEWRLYSAMNAYGDKYKGLRAR